MDTTTTAVVKPSSDKDHTTEQLPKALTTRVERLTDPVTQSLKHEMERQTGNRISRADEATIQLAVRSTIKAAIATIHYHVTTL